MLFYLLVLLLLLWQNTVVEDSNRYVQQAHNKVKELPAYTIYYSKRQNECCDKFEVVPVDIEMVWV